VWVGFWGGPGPLQAPPFSYLYSALYWAVYIIDRIGDGVAGSSPSGTPSLLRGISCSLAQGTEERWIKVGYTRNLVIKDRRAVRDGTVSPAKRTAVGPVARVSASGSSGARLAEAIWIACWSRAAISEISSVRPIGAGCQSRTTVLTAKDVDG
jgi:hypothetical protein